MAARLGYDIHGPDQAPVLVLGSSLGSTRAMWDPQLPVLAERFRVLRFDHRGHGDSALPPGPYSMSDLGSDLLGLLDSLAVQRFSYAGVSLGGMVGMWLAVHAPQRVRTLALCCTSAYMPPAQAWHDRVRAVRSHGMTSIADAVMQRWFTPGFAEREPELVERLRAGLTSTPVEGYAGCCQAIAGMDQRADLRAIGCPTLVLVGEHDEATPPSHGEQLAAAIPDARLTMVDAAHLATVERADESSRLLADFFAG